MRHKVFNLSEQPDIILGINLNSLNLVGCKITLRTLRISNARFTPLGRLAKLKSEVPITWARSLNKLHDCFVKQEAILIIKLVVTKCYTLALCCRLRMWQGSPMRNQPLRWEIGRKRRQWSGVGEVKAEAEARWKDMVWEVIITDAAIIIDGAIHWWFRWPTILEKQLR